MTAKPKAAALRLGVTGTDTGVGKTVVACALVALMRSRGFDIGVMKPVETGVTRGDAASDHMQLAAAAGLDGKDSSICPYVFDEPLAPWIAAKLQQSEVSIAELDAEFAKVQAGRNCVLVEGAGGLLVPLTRTLRFDELFAHWALDVIIVAADKLGVLNHTLLTVNAARAAGLKVRGVVLNQLHSFRQVTPGGENATALRELLPEVPVLEFPCVHSASQGSRLMEARTGNGMDMDRLRDLAADAGMMRLVLSD